MRDTQESDDAFQRLLFSGGELDKHLMCSYYGVSYYDLSCLALKLPRDYIGIERWALAHSSRD
jgi:hypothetical protein